MASYSVNEDAVANARRLIDARQYVLDSDCFVYGDFRRVHRTGLIACQYRAAEWRHKGNRASRTQPSAAAGRN